MKASWGLPPPPASLEPYLESTPLTKQQTWSLTLLVGAASSAATLWHVALKPKSLIRRLVWGRFAKAYISLDFPDAVDYRDGSPLGGEMHDYDLIYDRWVEIGRPKAFKMRILNIPFLATCDKKDLHLTSAARPEFLRDLKQVFGPESLLFKDEEEARKEKPAMLRAFSVHKFEKMQASVNAASARLRQRIDEDAADSKDGAVVLSKYLPRVSFEVMADAMGVDHAKAGMESRVQAILSIIGTMEHPLMMMPFGKSLISLLYHKEFSLMDDLVNSTIENRVRQRAALDETDRPSNDLLDVLLNSAEELKDHFDSKELANEWLKSNTQLIFQAGTDTTSLTIEFCLVILAARQSVQTRMKREFRAVFPPGEPVSFAKLEKLKYTTGVIKEVLRLYPTTGGIVRDVHELQGKPVPPNTITFLYFYLLHRNPEYFSHPTEFLPERWLPELNSGETADPEAMAAFSYGFRSCLGKHLAMQELRTMLVYLLRDRTVICTKRPEGVTPDELPRTKFLALLHVPKGYRVKFIPDQDA